MTNEPHMMDTLAYIVTSRRNSPTLAKSFGNHRGDAMFFFLTLEDAQAQLGRIRPEDRKYWMILPVLSRTNQEAWEYLKGEAALVESCEYGPRRRVE